jgi:hypothetical protein
VIRTLAVAAALAGAILLAPVAQAQPDSSTGPDNSNSVANLAPLSRGPTTVARGANKFVPTTTATPFGSPGTFDRQPGLVIADANGNMVVATTTAIPFGLATPMAKGNMFVPATTTTPLSGGIRTRHGRTGGTSLFGVLGRRFG